jgi:hypothetical protein
LQYGRAVRLGGGRPTAFTPYNALPAGKTKLYRLSRANAKFLNRQEWVDSAKHFTDAFG